MDDDLILAVFTDADMDGDGSISLEDFKQTIRRKPEGTLAMIASVAGGNT